MKDQDKTPRRQACKELAERIKRHLAGGITIDNKTLRYIEDALSFSDLPKLCDALRDPNHSEWEPLIALLFHPDESIQMELEGFLESAGFMLEDKTQVHGFLMEKHPRTTLMAPEGKSAPLPVQSDAAAFYLENLHIDRHPHPRILEALESAILGMDAESKGNNVGARQIDRVKVMLRNSAAALTPRKIDALCLFFARFPMHSSDFALCFPFFLDMLDAGFDEGDPADMLALHRNLYLKGLEKGGEIRRRLESKNPETWMLSGARAPHVDAEDLMKKIELIDRIQFRLYGENGRNR